MNAYSQGSVTDDRPRNDDGAGSFDSERRVVRLEDLDGSLTCSAVGRVSGGTPFIDCEHGHFTGDTFRGALASWEAAHLQFTDAGVSSGVGATAAGGAFASSAPPGGCDNCQRLLRDCRDPYSTSCRSFGAWLRDGSVERISTLDEIIAAVGS